MPPYEMVSQTAVGRDAHAVERSGTSTLGVHRAAPISHRTIVYRAGDRKGRPYGEDTDSHASDIGHWLGMTPQTERCQLWTTVHSAFSKITIFPHIKLL